MRVVADTNTIVSALLWGGTPAAVLAAARAERIQLFTTVALLNELAEVLARERFAHRLALAERSALSLMKGYRALATVLQPASLERISRDPDDDHVLACARAARADFIISGDNDVLDLRTLGRTPIITAGSFMARLEAGTGWGVQERKPNYAVGPRESAALPAATAALRRASTETGRHRAPARISQRQGGHRVSG